MSDDDIFSSLIHALRHGDKVAEQLLNGGLAAPFSQFAKAALPDRAIMTDRRFWTGAALGAAAVLAMTAAKANRNKGSVKDSDAPLSNPPPRKTNGLY